MSPTVSPEAREGGQERDLSPVLGRWQMETYLFFFVFFFRLPGYQAPFWLVLSTGGAAERAGVPPGARLLEVNGVSVEKFTYNQLSRKVWPAVFPHSGLTPLGPGAMPQAADSSPSHSSSHLTLYLLPSFPSQFLLGSSLPHP